MKKLFGSIALIGIFFGGSYWVLNSSTIQVASKSGPTLGLSTFQVVQGGTGATTLTGCLTGNGTSPITGTGTACGGASAYEIATTSDIAAPNLTYFTKTSGRTTLGSVATTTLTASAPLSLSNPVVKVGGSNSTLSLDTSGTWTGNAGTATALAGNGTNCSAGNYPLGVDASGNAEDCTAAGGGGSSKWATTTAPHTFGIYPAGAGYVGIGTTTPVWLLQLSSSTAPQLALGDADNNQFIFRTSGGAFYIATTSPTTFASTTRTNFSIGTNGYVGIGTANPGGPLTVIGPRSNTALLGAAAGNASNALITLAPINDSIARWGFRIDSTGNDLAIDYRDSASGNPFTSLFLTRIGTAGFGTTSPNPSAELTLASSTTGQLSLSHGTGISQWTLRNAGGDFFLSTTTVLGTATTSIPALSIIGSTGVLRVPSLISCNTIDTDADGNFACGTDDGGAGSGAVDPFTHPLLGLSATTSQMLFGTSTAGNFGVTIASSTASQLSLSEGAGSNQWAFRNVGGNFYLSTTTVEGTSTTSIPAFTITSSNGNVGIATGSPAYKFAVNLQSNQIASFSDGSSASAITTTNGSLISQTALFQVTAVGTNALSFHTAGTRNSMTNGTERARFLSTGAFGIGTTTPSGIFNTTIASTTGSQLSLSAGAGLPQWGFRNAGGNFYIGTTTVEGTATTTMPLFSIVQNTLFPNAFIGIGTTSPVAGLTVVGGAILNAESKPATSTAMTISLASSTAHVIQIGTAGVTITLSDLYAGQASRIVVCNPNATAGAVTWATSPAGLILWAGGTVPTQTTTANKCDLWTFTTTQATSTTGAVRVFGSLVPNY